MPVPPRGACRAREGASPAPAAPRPHGPPRSRYLVDSASSHMLVSKIKPCMSKFKRLNGETANGSLNQLSLLIVPYYMDTCVILELIHAENPNFGRVYL
ncbi:hypothetical protein P168DRAFT_339019 [Aspergillus campestris IBT 28561]|uniref:Uncharacterized protein n=1 Tax=Aspergillus campestris (strain IBT 28561) TaxID=1392248 RepID=A0A2I1CQ65_ASPC2|nr:hypothetical protein P168DRAFT_339019 [Aspergillus campestris IBT 28561]